MGTNDPFFNVFNLNLLENAIFSLRGKLTSAYFKMVAVVRIFLGKYVKFIKKISRTKKLLKSHPKYFFVCLFKFRVLEFLILYNYYYLTIIACNLIVSFFKKKCKDEDQKKFVPKAPLFSRWFVTMLKRMEKKNR